MPVFELSSVTSHLEQLFKLGIERRLQNAVAINTSSVSPLEVTPLTHLINVFLFHFHPDGKPTAQENSDIDPARPIFFSKPLTLFYHITAHHSVGNQTHLVEQDLLGHAMSVLIDYSELNDELTFGGNPLFDGRLFGADNEFEIEVLTKSDTEGLNVWAGHEGGAIQPSLYFKVKNVRLQPEPPASLAAPILSIGNLTLPNMGPRILSLASTMTARFPTASGPVDRQYTRAPAELYIGAGANDRSVTILGASIDHFVAVEISFPTSAGREVIRIDFDANGASGWSIQAVDGQVRMTAGTSIDRDVGGAMTPLALEPGSGQLRVLKTVVLSRDGEMVPTEIPSNPVSFTLHPHINQIVNVGGRRFRIELDGDYDLDAFLPAEDRGRFLRLSYGGASYTVKDDAAGLSPGECVVTGANRLEYILADGVDPAALAHVQLWVRDCVSQPFWAGAI